MNLLLTNDDGINADGLSALAAACRELGHDVAVVAPAQEQSMCGHRVTTHAPLILTKLEDRRYTVSGTPADCVRVAKFALGLQPDWVLSGVNHGGNLGQDIHISGTCAAAREAAYHGIPAAALSHYLIRDLALDWSRITRWLVALLPGVLERSATAGAWVNINFPHHPPGDTSLPVVVATEPETAPIGVGFKAQPVAEDPRSQWLIYSAVYAERQHIADSDVGVTFAGKVSVSHLRI